jgi:L-arabinonolactonase
MQARPDPVHALGGYRARTGESPVWNDADGIVCWLDIDRALLVRTDPATGQSETTPLPSRPGALLSAADVGLVVTLASGVWALSADGDLRQLAPNPHPGTRMNDAAVDPVGRLWFSTLAMAGGDGRVHCLAGREVTTDVVTGLGTPNGLAFSPGGDRMYLSDSRADSQGIWVYDYDLETGQPTSRRMFFDPRGKTGRPDGATVDATGHYWFAAVGGGEVVCLSPGGAILRRISLPVSRPTKPVFGGPALDRLFVTSIATEGEPLSGAVFEVRGPGFRGQPPAVVGASPTSAP